MVVGYPLYHTDLAVITGGMYLRTYVYLCKLPVIPTHVWSRLEEHRMASIRRKRQPSLPVIRNYSYCGKEYHFITKDGTFVERFLCPICQEILHEPVQTSCGHLFCRRCLQSGPVWNCLSCQKKLKEEPRRDKFNEREIRNLIVKCQNSSRGCLWEGELGNVESHQNGVCGYQLVQCGNKCGAEIDRRDVEKHKKDHCELRMYKCPYCTLYWDTYKKVTSEHFKECDGFPLDCPNNCGKKRIEKREMSSHLCACPKEVVPCRYQSLGCKVRLPRKQMKDHLKEKDTHLDIAMATTLELVAKLNEVECEHSVTKMAISNLEKQVDALLEKTSTVVQLPPPVPPSKPWLKEDLFPRYPPCTLRVELDQDRSGVSPYFFSHSGGYKLKLNINGLIYFISAVDEPWNFALKWPISVLLNFTILNQEKDKDHLKETYEEALDPKKSYEHTFLTFEFSRKYTKDGSVYIRIDSVDVHC